MTFVQIIFTTLDNEPKQGGSSLYVEQVIDATVEENEVTKFIEEVKQLADKYNKK